MFTHLRLHTEFSITDGTCRIDEIVEAASADKQSALAITDLNNLFATVKFYTACRKTGVKPIIGSEIFVYFQGIDTTSEPCRLLLLAKNEIGYFNLSNILTLLWTDQTAKTQPGVDWSEVVKFSDGLILLSGAQNGPIGQAIKAGNSHKTQEVALEMASAFKDSFYIELQRCGRVDDEAYISSALELASNLQLPVVATHAIQYLTAEDFEAHEARVCIAHGEILGNSKRLRRFTREQFFQTTAQMVELFQDVPSAITNSYEIAKRCNLSLTLGKPQLPAFPTPVVDGKATPVDIYFRELAFQGLDHRLAVLYPNQAELELNKPKYLERLEFEIATILKMGFPGYFLIVSDFINWAKKNGCPVGPGRGSGAGSLVAYSLNITDLDPLKYNLLFERFLNPERVSMPDFDIDFCQLNRDRVIDYVKNQYGRDAVSQIVTFGTMAARAAIRDVGRTLDMSYSFCEGLSKLIPNKPGQPMTIALAMEQEPILAQRYKQEDEVKILINLAQKLEGLTRNIGMHAGGVLIAPGQLTDFCPLYQQPGSPAAVSQFDKDDVESIGLVKFDFLGLATLTILEQAKKFIVSRYPEHQHFSYESIALDDQATYELFSKGKTEAVFQFESRGMQAMLKDAKPSRLEDLIVLNALFRPGPMSLIPSFVARKHGREEVIYPHPLAEPILSETYGIMVYQEQVMQIAQVLGGYSLGGADLLRRAMGKKKADEMALHRSIFREGAAKNNISTTQADAIFDLMEEFAGYGFNKSHAAAYSLLAYHTAWIKVHFPAEFFSANMTVEMDDTDKLKILYDDAVAMGVTFEMPDINTGVYGFVPVSNSRIQYGLGAIKGTGQSAIESIAETRESSGSFKSLFDFCSRIDRNKVNKRTLEALIKAGAFDKISTNRSALLASVNLALEFASSQEQHLHQTGLFDSADEHGSSTQEPDLITQTEWGVREKLTHEKSALGFHLSGHLFDEVESEIQIFIKSRLSDITESRDSQWIAGIVRSERTINTSRGKLNIFLLDDGTGSVEITCDDLIFSKYKNLIKEDQLVVVNVKVQNDRRNGNLRINLLEAMDLPAARCHFGKYLKISVNQTSFELFDFFKVQENQKITMSIPPISNPLAVRLLLQLNQGEVELQLGGKAKIYPTDEVLANLRLNTRASDSRIIYE